MKLLDLIWVDTDKSVDPAHKKIRLRLCARENETKKQGKFQKHLTCFSVVLCNATFCRTAQRLEYVRLPAEDPQRCGGNKVGKLNKMLRALVN